MLTVDDGRGGTDSSTTTAVVTEFNDVPISQPVVRIPDSPDSDHL